MYTLSIILNLHREGELAERTIKNLRNVLDFAQKKSNNWASIEVIAVLDNSDDITQQVVNKHNDLFSKIELVNYRDLADSRNHGVNRSSNNFVLFADGDDYLSHNALVALFDKFNNHYSISVGISDSEQLSALEYNQHIAVFPELLVEFPKLFFQSYIDSNDFIRVNMQFMHCYISRICCPRFILINNLVRANQLPYGYEDWDLNNRLLATGLKYQVASDYILYYRKTNSASLLQNQIKNKCIVRNSDIYSIKINNMHMLDNNEINKSCNQQNNAKKFRNSKIGLKIKSITQKLGLLTYVQNKLHSMDFKKQPKKLLLQSNQIIKKHKNFLLSYGEKVSGLLSGNPFGNMNDLSKCYSYEVKVFDKLCKFLDGKDIVFIIPWLKLGGADKVIVEYINAVKDIYNVGVITTLESGDRISSIDVPYIDLSGIMGFDWFNIETKLHLLLKSIINTNSIKLLHVVQSDLGLQLIKYYANALKEHNIKIMTSFFSVSYDPQEKKYAGYPVMYPELFTRSNIILSDNYYWYAYFKALNNHTDFEYSKLEVPTLVNSIKANVTKNNKILWASRFASEKLVNVFLNIAQSTPQYTYVVYTGEPENSKLHGYYKKLKSLSNVEIRSEYKSFDELNFDEFDLFLYTSLFDGIPNVVLEMGLAGLPIIAPNVGGISEVLGSDYYLLVKDCQHSQEYIEKINLYYQSTNEVIQNNVDKICNYIKNEHTKDKFQAKYLGAINKLVSHANKGTND